MATVNKHRDLKAIVPAKFWNTKLGGPHPTAKTVAQLIEVLKELPGDLSFGKGKLAQVILFNVSHKPTERAVMRCPVALLGTLSRRVRFSQRDDARDDTFMSGRIRPTNPATGAAGWRMKK